MLKERNQNKKAQNKTIKHKLKNKQNPTLVLHFPQHAHMQTPHPSLRQTVWASAVSLVLSFPLTPDGRFPHSSTGADCWAPLLCIFWTHLPVSTMLTRQTTNVCLSQEPWFLGIQPDLTGADVSTASVTWLSRFCLPHLHAIMPSAPQTKIIVSPWPCSHLVCLHVFALASPSGWSVSLSLSIRVLYYL